MMAIYLQELGLHNRIIFATFNTEIEII